MKIFKNIAILFDFLKKVSYNINKEKEVLMHGKYKLVKLGKEEFGILDTEINRGYKVLRHGKPELALFGTREEAQKYVIEVLENKQR